MKDLSILIVVFGILSFWLPSCTEINPISPPKKLTSESISNNTCKALPIDQNIIGTWHFESTYNLDGVVTSGIVTFDKQRNIIDPDSLFENRLNGINAVVDSKTYNPKVNRPSKQPSELFEVYQNTKKGTQTVFFVLVTNECNRIVLGLIGSKDYVTRFTLTR